MIALLSGQLAYKSPDHVIIDVGGVGYRVAIPLSTYYGLPDEGPVKLHIHTHVKEDAFHLYGFGTPEEKTLFTLLLSVSGIGPKVALNILSHIATDQFCLALSRNDTKALASLPGIGKKSAERLILELRDKIPESLVSAGVPTQRPPNANNLTITEDTLSALINLGYKEAIARKALNSLETTPEASLEDLLKGALKILAK